MIDSRRGASGGYLLSRPANQITLRQIVEAVEPSQLQNTALDQGESGSSVRRAWENVSNQLTKNLEEITLESLASPGSDPMFYI